MIVFLSAESGPGEQAERAFDGGGEHTGVTCGAGRHVPALEHGDEGGGRGRGVEAGVELPGRAPLFEQLGDPPGEPGERLLDRPQPGPA
ncbi:hypothetical protein AB0K12_21570 [Nonomuraea sp. NPDC049419]|uniref:hypothetical protein n=1 Tax=Nonomuraea sp. NPDC049419 TaxID=3155772 RepID=UPI00341DD21A